MAGVIPGIIARPDADGRRSTSSPAGRSCRASRERRCGEVVTTVREAIWGLLLIVIILGGIYGGVFTPTEAAAVAAVYAFLVAVFVYRDIGPLKDRPAGAQGGPGSSARGREQPAAGGAARNLCGRSRAVGRLPAGDPGPQGRQARRGRGGPHHDHAHVHHRQRVAVRPRAHDRAHPAHHHGDRSSRPGSHPGSS